MDNHNNSNAVNGVRGVRLRMSRTGHLNLAGDMSSVYLEKADRFSRTYYPKTIPQRWLFFVYLSYAALFGVQIYLERFHHPRPLTYDDEKNHPGEFIAERAMSRLIKLTDIGPRVAGSYENEVRAVEMLRAEIEAIIEEARPVHKIEMDIRKYSGSFPLMFLDGLTNVYENVQNVAVRLSSKKSSDHSLLMNCHFDSVPDSPGGSDDGAGCAVLLEILDVLSKSDEQLEHNIVFLFNGAEENLLHGSHGFITQHPWAKKVRAFVNLEACGAGGREVLFQSGPNSPWIMEVYAKSVLHPFASSMAQEVFESGLIPGDTDFRVFRDFGNISGLDFAWSSNGYVYHTKYDNVDQIPLGVLQRTGENMLALAKGLANAAEMKDVSRYHKGNMIYFDVMGLYLVRWSEKVGTLINICTVLLSCMLLYVSALDAKRKDIKPKTYVRYLFKTLITVILGGLGSIVSVLCTSSFLSLIGRSMSWYNHPIWLLFLYIIPSAATIMAVQIYFSEKFIKVIPSRMLLFQMYFDVYQALWTVVLFGSVVLKIRSGYVAWKWVIGPCMGILIHRLIKSPLLRGPDWKWLLFLLSSVSLPVIQHIYMQVGCLALFIPIMGRSGASLNSEIVIALFTNVTFGMLFGFIAPLVILVANPKKTLSLLTTLFLAALIIVIFTPLGFPYSGNIRAPRPQRYMILHTERTFFNSQWQTMRNEGGYWIVDHDYNSPHSVKPFVPEMSHAELVDKDCDDYLYCGLPYLMPVLSFIRKTHWIPGHLPKIITPTVLTVLSKSLVRKNIVRVTVEIKGPDHMGVIISPKPKVEFLRWSLNHDDPVKGPRWKDRDTYFVYYASSSEQKPWVFFMDFRIMNSSKQDEAESVPHYNKLETSLYNETLMDFVLTSHFLHGPHKTHLSFRKILAQFPSWTAVTAWTATYKSFII